MRSKKNKRKRIVPPLGVRNWQSYAFFQAGVRWRMRREAGEARRMFLRALDHDDENRGALLNLGILDVEDKDYRRALRRLHRARSIAAEEVDFEKGSVWYKATYQIAAAYSYQAAAKRSGDVADSSSAQRAREEADRLAQRAREEADRLTEIIRQTLNEIRETRGRASTKNRSDATEALQRFLESLEPLAEILHAGIMVEQDELEQASEAVSKIMEQGELPYRVRYNLACYYSRRASKEVSRQDEFYDKALTNLREAFEGDGALARWAADDPALEGLRAADHVKNNQFARLREKYIVPASPAVATSTPLAGLAAVGKIYAEQLRERGVASEDDLIIRAATPEAQEKLADELGIDVDLVRRWALLADLLRVVGLDTRTVNLMEVAGVGSLHDLRSSDPERLTRLLSQVNRARSLVDRPPAAEMVQRWVNDAKKNTLPKVRSP